MEPVAAKLPGRTDARQDPEAGLADGSLPSLASQDVTKPASLSTSLAELSDQDRTTPLALSPAEPTLLIAAADAADVMPPGEAHSADVPVESQSIAPDAPETTHMSHSMPEPGLVDASPGIRVAEGDTQAPLVEFTDPDETGRFAMVALEMAVPIAEPEGIMPVAAPAAEMLAQSTAVRPIGPDIAHVPSQPRADSTRPAAQRAIQRKVDIEQIAESVERSPHKAQPEGLGWRDGGNVTLAAKIDAMQVPPFALAEQELAAFRTEAPVEMTVRVGGEAVGKVAFRMAGTRMIEVQLAGLLDLVADRLAPAEFVRLRASAAANSFVPMQQLRAIGLTLRYDPVYDELLISA